MSIVPGGQKIHPVFEILDIELENLYAEKARKCTYFWFFRVKKILLKVNDRLDYSYESLNRDFSIHKTFFTLISLGFSQDRQNSRPKLRRCYSMDFSW